MKRSVSLFAIVAIGALSVTAVRADDLRDRQTAACTNDAFRLCGDAIPDETRITACMAAKRAALTPGCRAFFVDASMSADSTSSKVRAKSDKLGRQPVSVR
jgi:hypothetical protein